MKNIPLSAIPGKPKKKEKREFTEAYKIDTVNRLADEILEQVARDQDVSSTLIRGWANRIDPQWQLKAQMNRANKERIARLGTAAMIVEREGTRGAEIAMRIRQLANPGRPTESYLQRLGNRGGSKKK